MIYEETMAHPETRKLINRFIRKLPKTDVYKNRLHQELVLIIKKNFVEYLINVRDILDLVNDIPHIIRGSAGSSLICYCLGITNINPVKEDICFARFLNDKRETMPDVDMDFPYNVREKVFSRLHKKYPNMIARISNHLYYKEKSAMRQAIREVMIEKNGKSTFVPKNKCKIKYFPEWKKEIKKKYEQLLGEFRCYSLHCGGIIYYPSGIPDNIRLDSKTINQIKFNKDQVADNGLFKIDILSNRGLAQLIDSNMKFKMIEDYPETDKMITKLFKYGFNLGLTFSESPAMRKLLTVIQPKNISQVAFCLAMVRPAAAGDNKSGALNDMISANMNKSISKIENYIIYDDDAINYIKNIINCNESNADMFRKAYSKHKLNKIAYFNKIIAQFSDKKQETIHNKLSQLRKYSFCKSHAISYAKLVWALAYQKVYHPVDFWLSTLNHCHSSYKKWVHYNEAKNAGIRLCLEKGPYKLKKSKSKYYTHKLIPILDDKSEKRVLKKTKVKRTFRQYLKDRNMKECNKMDSYEQLKLFGYWTSHNFIDNMYLKIDKNINTEKGIYIFFRGLIACGRNLIRRINGRMVRKTFITIGYDNGKYLDLTLDSYIPFYNFNIVTGTGYLRNYLKFDNKPQKINLESNGLMVNVDTYTLED